MRWNVALENRVRFAKLITRIVKMPAWGDWKDCLSHIGLGIALPVAEAFLLLAWIVVPQGYVFFGDTSPLTNPLRLLTSGFSVLNFNSDLGTSTAFLWLPYLAINWFSSLFVGPALTSRVLTVLIAAMPGFFMYVGAFILSQYWVNNNTKKYARLLFSFVASQVYLFSFVNQGLWNPFFNPWTFSYAILPLVLAGFWIWIFHGRLLGLVILGVGSVLSSPNPFWTEEAVLLVGPLFLACWWYLRKELTGKIVAGRLLLGLGSVLLANLFWILPVLLQYQLGTAIYSRARIPLSFDGMLGASRGFTLLDVVLYGHSTYYLFGTWAQNWSLANIVPALFTYIPFLLPSARKGRRPLVIGLGASLLIGLFLAKGANPPLGIVFYEVGVYLPLGFGVFFRNGGNIFMEQVLVVTAVLIGFTFVELAAKTGSVALKNKFVTTSNSERDSANSSRLRWSKLRLNRLRSVGSIMLIALAFLAVILPIMSGTVIDQQVYGPRFVATEIPSAYFSANSFLENQPGSFNVAWIPNGCCNVPFWKPNILTNFPAAISSRSAIPNLEPYLTYLHVPKSNALRNWSALLGIRYILIHSDFLGYPLESLNQSLNTTPGMDLAFRAGFIDAYEVHSPWIPQTLYVLPALTNSSDGFPALGGSQFIEVSHRGANGTTLNFNAGQDFTIAAWEKTTNSTTQIVAQDNQYGGTWMGWTLGLWNGAPWFQAGQTNNSEFQGLVANESVADGTWHFLVGERAGTVWRLFVDGQLEAEKYNMQSIPIETSQNASIGARVTSYGGNTWFFDGSLANIQLYGRALNATETGGLYNSGLRVSPDMVNEFSPLFSALPFNDNLNSPRDFSGSGFRLVPSGALRVGVTVLPLEVGQPSTTAQVVSLTEETATSWKAQLVGQGQITLVLAEPFTPGWEASWPSHMVLGFPLFDGVVTAFNLTINAQTSISLHYVYQNALVLGTFFSLFGFPVLILAVWLRKRAVPAKV
jgi:hypothetical protein